MDFHYINEVIKGNTEAFGHLINKYQNQSFGLAISIVKEDEVAKDMVQESFLTAFSSLKMFRNDSKFSTWLYRIVVNTSLQHEKKRKRKEEVVQSIPVSDDVQGVFNDGLDRLHKEDLKKLIKRTFARIPSKEALVLQLYYIDDKSINDICLITKFTKSNTKVLLHRGRTSFYNLLQKERIIKPY